MTFKKYKQSIVQQYFQRKRQREENKLENKYQFSDEKNYTETCSKQEQIELARHKNVSHSFTEMMNFESNRTMLFLTATFPSDLGVYKYANDQESISNHLKWQSKSISFFMRKLFKSKKYKKEKGSCRANDPLHYLWTVELQAKGDMHLHAVVFLKDDTKLVQHFVKRFHVLRAKYWKIMQVSDSGKSLTILPFGRCHIGMHPKFRPTIESLSMFDTRADLKNPESKHNFLTEISHIATKTGQGTAIEFYGKKKLESAYSDIVEYVSKLAEAKYKPVDEQKILKQTVHQAMVDHHTKGTSDKYSDEKLKVDSLIFSHIKVRTMHYSQVLFPTSLYQTVRTELIGFRKGYKSLFTLTVDVCKGYIKIIGEHPYRTITHKNKKIATEQRWKEDDSFSEDDMNEYALSKERV
jgi:hypothetical protein